MKYDRSSGPTARANASGLPPRSVGRSSAAATRRFLIAAYAASTSREDSPPTAVAAGGTMPAAPSAYAAAGEPSNGSVALSAGTGPRRTGVVSGDRFRPPRTCRPSAPASATPTRTTTTVPAVFARDRSRYSGARHCRTMARRVRRARRRLSHPGRRARSRAEGSVNAAPLTKSSSKGVDSVSPGMVGSIQ